MSNEEYEIEIYAIKGGKEPFTEWLYSLRDQRMQRSVLLRIQRIRLGNFGDHKVLTGASNIYEIRINLGPGLRVYFIKLSKKIILLLGGGDKSSQKRDIEHCMSYLQEL